MPHFFIESKNLENNVIKIDDAENYRHIAKALRIRVGEGLLLIDENRIQYETVVKEVTSKEIFCSVEKSYLSKRDLEFDLYLAQSPLRSDAQLTVMEKATELGARAVYPVITDNCALNKTVLEKKQEKWQKVMFEACKQCERAIVPTCYPPTSLEEVLKKDFDKIILGVGPGAYTGLRVSMSVAKMFSWTLNIPLYKISSLDLLSSGYKEDGLYILKLKAKKGFIYHKAFTINNGIKTTITGDVFVSDDYIENYKDQYTLITNYNMLVDPLNINNNEVQLVDNVHALEPNYLRES